MTKVNNIQPLTALHTMKKHSSQEAQNFNQLSTGKKLTKASDDVVGMAKAKGLEKAVRGLDAVEQNINNASHTLDTAAGGLNSTLSQLQNLRELAVRGADDTLSVSQRRDITRQAQDTMQEINRTAQSVKFDGRNLLDGSMSEGQEVQIGENGGDTQTVNIESATLEGLDLTEVDLSSADSAASSLDMIDTAITEVSSRLAQIGSKSETLTQAASHNKERSINLSQARSVTEDLDYALALGELKATQIKKQSTSQTLSALLQSSQQAVSKLL